MFFWVNLIVKPVYAQTPLSEVTATTSDVVSTSTLPQEVPFAGETTATTQALPPPKPIGQDWPHPGGEVLAVSSSSDGKIALSINSEGLIKFWNMDSGRMVRSIDFDSKIVSAAFFEDKKVALAGHWDEGNTIVLLDIVRDEEIETTPGHKGGIKTIAFSPNGETILSGGWDKEVMLWGTKHGDLVRIFKGHTHSRGWNIIGFFGDIFGDLSRWFQGWFMVHSHQVNAVAFSPDRAFVAAGSADGKITIWDVNTGNIVRTMTSHKKGTLAVAFSPNGRFILTGGLDSVKPSNLFHIKLWDVASGKQMAILGEHQEEVTSLSFSPDGKAALSADRQGRLKLWDITAKKEIRMFEGSQVEIRSTAFSSDGNRVLAGGSGKLTLWDPSTGYEVGPFVPKRADIEQGVPSVDQTEEIPITERRKKVPRGRKREQP